MSAETDWFGIIYSFVGRDFAHLEPQQALEAHCQAIDAEYSASIERKDAAIAELVEGLKNWLGAGLGNSTEFVLQAHAYSKGQALIAKHDTPKAPS